MQLPVVRGAAACQLQSPPPSRSSSNLRASATPHFLGHIRMARVPLASLACSPATQHISPISMMATPMTLRMSTRSRSVHGAPGWPSKNSCTRNSNPNPEDRRAAQNGSAAHAPPRRSLLRANDHEGAANEIPEAKRTTAPAAFRPVATSSSMRPAARRRPATRRSNASGTSQGTRSRASSRCRERVFAGDARMRRQRA